MDPQLKIYKKQIDNFFGSVKHHIRTYVFRNVILIDIEYEDFQNEEHVTLAIRKIIGLKILLNVKRDCTDKMMKQIFERHGRCLGQKELHSIMSAFEGS